MNNKRLLIGSFLLILIIILGSCRTQKPTVKFADLVNPKREFRGAWLSTAWQSRYRTMTPEQMKEYFVTSLDKLQADGINAIIFQVRPQADAFYKSKHEPWSAHLSGTQGTAPANGFDPLAFLVDECHNRGMELHAWLNPYRVTTTANEKLASSHIYHREPERFLAYGDKIYFDPGLPQNREFIVKVVKDIILNYNVDAIHMDDYFYPYPITGVDFPDNKSFASYGGKFESKNDWRRDNVNLLIKEVKNAMLESKPWVRFGISPFGIYRNKKSTIDGSGSETNGLQNYDDLFADVKLWVKEGWIDYNMPQLYWEIGHKSADYATLLKWWSENNYQQHLYIGQDAKRSMDAKNQLGVSQLDEKLLTSRSTQYVSGNCFWPAYSIIDNYNGIADRLRENFHQYPALIPAYEHMYAKAPKNVEKLTTTYQTDARLLEWQSNHEVNNPQSAQYYVVYRFDKKEKEDLDNARKIVKVTNKTYYVLPYERNKGEYKYVVTAVDAFHNESKGKKIKVKL